MCWTGLLPSRKQRLFIPVEATEESACLCLLLATLISHWVHFTWARNNFCLLLVLPAPFLRRLSVLGVPRLALTPFRQCSPSPLERSVRSLPQVSAPRAGPSHPVILVSLKHRGGVSVPPSGPSLAPAAPCPELLPNPSLGITWVPPPSTAPKKDVALVTVGAIQCQSPPSDLIQVQGRRGGGNDPKTKSRRRVDLREHRRAHRDGPRRLPPPALVRGQFHAGPSSRSARFRSSPECRQGCPRFSSIFAPSQRCFLSESKLK